MNIPVVDNGTTPGSVTGSVPSFQQFLGYQSYVEENEFVFLNVRVGVDCVKVGLDLLGPAQKSYRDALTTGTGTQKTLPAVAGTEKTFPRDAKRVTLNWWKLYLDSCATYHTAFVDWLLDNVHEVDTILTTWESLPAMKRAGSGPSRCGSTSKGLQIYCPPLT